MWCINIFTPHHLGILMFSMNCKLCFCLVPLYFKSSGSWTSCSIYLLHRSWIISFGSNVTGAISPTGSYIKLIKLSNPLFVKVAFLATPFMQYISFWGYHIIFSDLSTGISSKSNIFGEYSLGDTDLRML